MLNRSVWSTLLEESITLLLPVTPYRSFPPSQVIDSRRLIKGLDAVMLDSMSVRAFLQAIVPVWVCGDVKQVIIILLAFNLKCKLCFFALHFCSNKF